MSNIFNLLGGMAESDNKGQMIKPIIRSKTSYEIRPNSLKTLGDTKPKGLSIRSNSDINVSHNPINIKKNIYSNKEQDGLKLKVTQIDNNGRPISPRKETLHTTKKLIAQSFKFKEPALKEENVTNKSTKMLLSDSMFKKPLPLKKNIKRFPKPEELAHWYNDQHEFDYGHIKVVEKEFKDLLSKEKENIESYEQKEFMSDLETLPFPEISKLVLDKSIEEEYKKLSLDLPEMSDISDDDNL